MDVANNINCKLKILLLSPSLALLNTMGCESLRHINCQTKPNQQRTPSMRLSDCTLLGLLDLTHCAVNSLDLFVCVHLQTLSIRECLLESQDVSARMELKIRDCQQTSTNSPSLPHYAVPLDCLSCERCSLLEVLNVKSCNKLCHLHCADCPRMKKLCCAG